MERLTERSLDYCTQMCPDEKMFSCAFYKDDQAERCLIANMYDRLAAYEDTGLEPEQIKEANQLIAAAFDLCCKHSPDTLLGRLKDILVAEDEGRLVILPCKRRDTVYLARRYIPDIWESKVERFHIDEEGIYCLTRNDGKTGGFDGTGRFGRNVFLTRAEAEKAMEVSEDA